MEQVYDSEKFSYATEPVAADKPAADNKHMKSRILMAVFIIFVVCFSISVASLVAIFLVRDGSPKLMNERFSQMELTIKELSTKVQADENQLKILKTEITELRDMLNERQQDQQPAMDNQQDPMGLPQNLSVEVNAKLNDTQQNVWQNKQDFSRKTSSKQQSDALSSCPYGYTLNPYAQSCIRLVSTGKSWYSAKSYCASAGERLATFETLESQYWFITLRKTSWQQNNLWVGGENYSTGAWRWVGETPMHLAVWGEEEPNNNDENCMASWTGQDYKFNDAACSRSFAYVCEQT